MRAMCVVAQVRLTGDIGASDGEYFSVLIKAAEDGHGIEEVYRIKVSTHAFCKQSMVGCWPTMSARAHSRLQLATSTPASFRRINALLC
jgi:hypothetical protein